MKFIKNPSFEIVEKIINLLEVSDISSDCISIDVSPALINTERFGYNLALTISNHPDFADLNKELVIVSKGSTITIYYGSPEFFSVTGNPDISKVEYKDVHSVEEAVKEILKLLTKFIALAADRNIKMCRDFIRSQLETLHTKIAEKDFFTYFKRDNSLDKKRIFLKGRKLDLLSQIVEGTPTDEMRNSFEEWIKKIDTAPVSTKSEVVEVLCRGNISEEEIEALLNKPI